MKLHIDPIVTEDKEYYIGTNMGGTILLLGKCLSTRHAVLALLALEKLLDGYESWGITINLLKIAADKAIEDTKDINFGKKR